MNMGKYNIIKREFAFLTRLYGFEICSKQKHGSYYFALFTNANVKIMVLYDVKEDNLPISIRIYDANSFSFNAVEYKSDFAQNTGSPQKRIHYAAEWLKNAITNGIIRI